MSPAMRKPRNVRRERERLLVALCRREPGASDSLTSICITDPDSRREFIDLAVRHRVVGLVLAALDRNRTLAGLEDARQLLVRLRRKATMYEAKRDHIVEALAAAGLRPVVLKGAAIAGTLYREPVERDQADLDLLVAPGDYKNTVRALLAEGYELPAELRAYRRHHFHLPLQSRLQHWVEVHWALVRPGAPFHMDPRSVLEHAFQTTAGGQPPMVVPRPEHMLLHIVLQNLQEGFCRLARMVDIDRIVAGTADLDWEFLVSEAGRGNLESPVALSLKLSQRLFDTPLDEVSFRRLEPTPAARFHLAIARPVQAVLSQRLNTIDTAKHLLHLWLVKGARNRWLVLRKMLQPEPRAVAVGKESPGLLHRIPRLGKLAVLHVLLYFSGAASLVLGSGRDQMRFWSSQASSSDRL